jgi:ubiquinone/menaquinone biosynthesis C-methylase UbiE
VLEIGCGIGVDAIQFARGGNDMYVVDLSPNSVRLTLGRFGLEKRSAHAAVVDAENLPFAPETFDVVYSYGVLQHTPDTEGTIDHVYRVLKPGGKAMIMLYAKYSALALLQTFMHHGLRKGRFFKLWSFQRVLDEWTELGSKTGELANPLSRAFTIAECKKMFHRFSTVQAEKHFLRPSHFAEARHLLPLMPSSLRAKLPRLLGWNIVIKATK